MKKYTGKPHKLGVQIYCIEGHYEREVCVVYNEKDAERFLLSLNHSDTVNNH